MAIKGYVGNKSPLTIGVIAVFVVAVVAALFGGGNISGRATSVTEVPMPADSYPSTQLDVWQGGWSDCSQGEDWSWDAVNQYCTSKGYSGAAPTGYRPCKMETKPTRIHWSGETSVDANGGVILKPVANTPSREAGMALTAVKCI